MNTPTVDRRLDLRWYRLTEQSGVMRVITPIVEEEKTAIPGIMRFRDAKGRVGFVDQLWYRDHAVRIKQEELSSVLPVMAPNEIERVFPPAPKIVPVATTPRPVVRPPQAKRGKPLARKKAGPSKPRVASPVDITVRPKRTLVRDDNA